MISIIFVAHHFQHCSGEKKFQAFCCPCLRSVYAECKTKEKKSENRKRTDSPSYQRRFAIVLELYIKKYEYFTSRTKNNEVQIRMRVHQPVPLIPWPFLLSSIFAHIPEHLSGQDQCRFSPKT